MKLCKSKLSFIPSSKKLSLSFFQILHTVFIYAFFFSDLFNGRFSVCANLSLAISKLLILWWIFILWHANNDLTCMSVHLYFPLLIRSSLLLITLLIPRTFSCCCQSLKVHHLPDKSMPLCNDSVAKLSFDCLLISLYRYIPMVIIM